MSQDAVAIVAARRTPVGAFSGSLSTVPATELSATATRACIEDAQVDVNDIDSAMIGCVLQAGVGQGPARQAALGAGLGLHTHCVTINKVCGSSIMTATMATDMLRAGSADIAVAGGMESMSLAPYLLPSARAGYRMGHQQAVDHMFFDGLTDAYSKQMMGDYGEATAKRYGFTREQQDAFAIASVERAQASIASGAFTAEIAPVKVKHRKQEKLVDTDEEPGRGDPAKIPTLRPAFAKDGTITAASSSSLADGAASLILMRAADAKSRQTNVLAHVVGHASHSLEPEWFTTGPIHVIRKLLKNLGWSAADVDLFEINEAFACVTMAAMQELELDHSKVNVNGGSCALGHPLGATGARILVTLIHALHDRGGKRGIAAACIGGGEAMAIAIEIP